MKNRKTIPRKCEHCQTPFDARVDLIQRGCGRFCSRACMKLGFKSRTHGQASGARCAPTYRTWKSMHSRCRTSKRNYEHVSVCARWSVFENFLADMGERPEGLTIDRIDGRLGYFKENCRWASRREQAQNLKSNVYIEHDGKSLRATDWARELGLRAGKVFARVKAGYPPHLILSQGSFKGLGSKRVAELKSK